MKEIKEKKDKIQVSFSIDKKKEPEILELYNRFRDKVYKKTKLKQGSIKECLLEAIRLWLEQNSD